MSIRPLRAFQLQIIHNLKVNVYFNIGDVSCVYGVPKALWQAKELTTGWFAQPRISYNSAGLFGQLAHSDAGRFTQLDDSSKWANQTAGRFKQVDQSQKLDDSHN